MPLSRSLDELLANVTRVSLPAFLPELVVCATIVLLLLGRLFGTDRVATPRWVALGGAIVAFAAAAWRTRESVAGPISLFGGMLVHDPLTTYMRALLTGCLVLAAWTAAVTGLPDREDGPDFHALLFGSTLGALLMAQTNHLLMLFLSVEMTSVPAYALVGFQKGRRTSGEAALKYLVYGAGAAGVLLYGTSLLAGTLGTASLPELTAAAERVWTAEPHPLASAAGRTAILGVVFVFAGLAFKLALVPFHFWCPDAFEGASAEAAGLLSVAPKAAAFALLVRFIAAVFGSDAPEVEQLRSAFGIGLAAVAALSMTLGNLAAFPQENVKRLFAYSTIAQAGYLLMGVAAWTVAGGDAGRRGLEGLLYYLAVYVFMNMAAFAVVAVVRNATYGERVEDCRGLGFRLPVLGIATAACCASLVGLPPTGGLIGKLMVFAASLEAGSVRPAMWLLVAVAAINTVWSVFYYFRLLHAMYFQSPVTPERLDGLRPSAATDVLLLGLTAPLLILGVAVAPLSRAAAAVAESLVR